MKSIHAFLCLFMLATRALAQIQVPAPPPPPPERQTEKLQSFKFEQADLDLVMSQYCSWTGKIYLKNDAVKASITVKADRLTVKESIQVIEAILAMNDIAIVPWGEKFVKVVPAGQPGTGVPVIYDPTEKPPAADALATQIFPLKNPMSAEMEKAIRQLMNSYGQYLPLESSNSLMITDTTANLLRIRELIEFLDQGTAAVESRIYQITYADATEIAAKINEIVAMAQADQRAPVATPNVRTPPGVIRSRQAQMQAAAAQPTSSGGSAPIIQGTVKVMADERTNLVMIFSPKVNFEFFDHMIQVLDIEVEPPVSFEVVSLEYADAEELSSTLNELIGAAQSTKKSQGSNGNRETVPPAQNNAPAGALQNLSQLSENAKILADSRSNSILLMGRRNDIASIKTVIASLDIKLEQVLIEAAIFEVTLGEELAHGIDWLYRSTNQDKLGAWDGRNLLDSTNGLATVAANALSYYQNIPGINTEIAINLAASDSNVRLLSTPVIMTTDNTEARLSVGEQRPVVTATSSYANSSGTSSSTYSYKDIGIQLTVTPRINPQRVVVMEILQKADQVGDQIKIDNNDVPVILNREFEAQISVPDRGTVALGGLVSTEMRDSVSKIPLLGDIPLIGRWLFSSTRKEERQTELVVLLTPYVLTDETELERETTRIYDSTDIRPADWEKSWSGSDLQTRDSAEQR